MHEYYKRIRFQFQKSKLFFLHSDFFLSSVTIMKTVIGASIVSMPFVVKQMGYILFIIAFVVAMILNEFGTILLLKSKNLSKHSNYSTILFQIWNSKLSKALGSILIFLNNIGICTRFLTQALDNSSFSKLNFK